MNAVQQLLTDHIDIWTAAETEKKTGRGRATGNAASVYGINKLRELILELAVRGKLVSQDSSDESASELLTRIKAEKSKLISTGKIKKNQLLNTIADEEKPFDLPYSWEWARLGFIGNTQTGATPSKSNPESFGSDIPFVKPGDIYKNYVQYDNEGLSFLGAAQSGRVAQSGSVLMVCIGTIGKCNLIERDCSFNQQINSITPYILDSRYLLWVCRSNYFHTEAWSRSSSTTIAILNKGNWEEICVPIPPLEEQRRIVAKVDELMALCDQLEAQHGDAADAHEKLVSHLLGTLTQSQSAADFNTNWQRIAAHFDALFTTETSIDALKQTLLQLAVMGKLVAQDANDEPASELLKRIQDEKAKLLAEGKIKKVSLLVKIGESEKQFALPRGWALARLSDVFDVRDGTHDSPKFQASGYPFVTSKNLYSGSLDLTEVKFISEDDHRKYSVRSNVQRGDILFAMIGSIGNPVIVDVDIEFSIKNVALIKLYCDELSNRQYLLLHLRSSSENMKNEAGGGVQSFISLGNLRKHLIPMPPLAEQQRIVERVDELVRICDNLKSRIVKANQQQRKLADVLIMNFVNE